MSRKRRAVLGSTVHTMAPPRRPPKDLGPLTPTALRDYVRFNGGKTVIQHFRVLDADGSGDLTSKEFLQGVRVMGFVNATKEEAAFVWDWLDKDGDGVIPYKEMDKRIRDRPIETEEEAAAREAEAREAAEKAAAEERAAQAAAEAAAKAEAAAEKESKASAKAAAKAAAKIEKAAAVKAKNKKSGSAPPSPKSPKAKKSSPLKTPKAKPPPPPFHGFRGDEGFVRPTLAAHGYPVHAPPAAADEMHTTAATDPKCLASAAPAVKPVGGNERFLKPTIGTASLSDVTGAGFASLTLTSSNEISSHHQDSTRAPISTRRARPELGSAAWKPTTAAPSTAALSVRTAGAGGRVSQCELAARELEAKKEAEAARRERVRKLALRAAEEAEFAPLPTKHPDPPNWACVPAHERKPRAGSSSPRAEKASGPVLDFRAPDDNVFAFVMDTMAGGDRLLSVWADDDERLWEC